MAVLSYLDSEKTKRTPMTREQTDMFVRCTMADQASNKMLTEEDADKCGAIGKILYHRLRLAGPVEVSLGLALFVMGLTGGVPGKIVMWGYTLNRMFKKKAESIGGCQKIRAARMT